MDPFSGSGTSITEAASLGWNSIGVEVNPFLALVSKVKSEKCYDKNAFVSAARAIWETRSTKCAPQLPRNTTLVHSEGLKKWLFEHEVIRVYENLMWALKRSRFSPKYKRLLKLILIASMVDCCNAKRDGKCWRYKKDWMLLRRSAGDFFQAFKHRVHETSMDLEWADRLSGQASLIVGDSRKVIAGNNFHRIKGVDLVITSPPYLNSFDYTDIYRPELLLGGWFKGSEEMQKLRAKTIRSHVQTKWPRCTERTIPEVTRICNRLGKAQLWDKDIPNMVAGYFCDMDKLMSACKRRLKRKGYMCVVVASSAYDGIVIPTDLFLERLFLKNGFEHIETLSLRKTLGNGNHQGKSHKKLNEALIVVRKP